MGLEQSLVAVMLGESKDQTVGAGVLVDDNLIVTCAHVVNEALGRSQDQTGRPKPDAVIQVRFHSAFDSGNQATEVRDWTDPPTWRAPGADICVLRLRKEPPPGVGPASLRAFTSPAGLQFRAGGYPDNWEFDIAQGAVAGVDGTGLWVLRPDPALFAAVAMSKPAGGPLARRVERPAGLIHAGFSGGPVEIKDRIAGIIAVSREKITDATSYMIPVSAFPASLSALVESYTNPIAERYPHVQGLAARLDKLAENKRIDKTSPFDIRLRLCDDFSQVLEAHRAEPADPLGGAGAGSSSEYVDKRDLRPRELARSLKRGRDSRNSLLSVILINAPGGAGKTSFLFELLRVAADEGLVPFYLDFSRNAPEGVAGENVKLPLTRAYLENWFGTFSGEGPVDLLLQLARGGSDKPLLIIDGFNQSKRNWQNELERIGMMAGQELAGAAIIVADRMIHRGELGSFRLAVIPPLSQSALAACLPESASRVVASDPAWLSILSAPLFLNIFRDIDKQVPTAVGNSLAKAIPSRFSVISNYFMDVCKFTKREMSVLSAAAFRAYEAFGQTAIPRALFESILKEEAAALAPAPGQRDLLAQIEHHGLIHDIGDNDIEFRHQIIHDYLASMRVASAQEDEDEVLLRAPAFDTLSLDSASSDAIELAVEALNEPGRLPSTRREPLSVRAFLTEVYDWNYWISLQCVTSFDRRCLAELPIPEWMRHAVYALNLEKQFDPFLHTAARAGELKSLIVRSAAVSYASASNPEELVDKVGEVFRELDDPAALLAAGKKSPGML
jgi:trypsin-like peptidase